MSIKLRPGTHYTRVDQGVAFAQRNTSFVLKGPASLYDLIDVNLDQLLTGTDAAGMADTVGNPAAAPLFERIIDALRERDVLLDTEVLDAPPPVDEMQRFGATLAYCESMCRDPYRSFAALRAARVTVTGTGPAIAPLIRSLTDMGVGSTLRQGPSDLTVRIQDVDEPAAIPQGPGRVVTVVTTATVAVVGPVTPSPDTWTPALARRAAHWASLDPTLAAPQPLSAVLAGALAARAVLDHLLGIAGPAMASIVHGRLLETTQIAAARPELPAVIQISPVDPAGAVLAHTAPMTARFSGPLCRGSDEDLPQLPLSLATARAVEGGDRLVGWGTDRGAAGLDVLLRATRARTGSAPGAVPSGAVAAAGMTAGRADLDGLLRMIGAGLLVTPGEQIGWEQVPASRPRALWSVLEDHFGARVRLTAHAWRGGPWVLVTARDGGGIRSMQWGFSLASAVFCALGEVLMQIQQLGACADPMGTHVLAWAPEAAIAEGLAAGRSTGRSWQSANAAPDEVLGDLPIRTGWTWWT